MIRLLIYTVVLGILLPALIICSKETEFCMQIQVKVQYFKRAISRTYGKIIESSFSSTFNSKMEEHDQSGSLGVGLDSLVPEVGPKFGQTYGKESKNQAAECKYWENDEVFQNNTMQIYEESTYKFMVDGESVTKTELEYVDTQVRRACNPDTKKLTEMAEEEIKYRYNNCTFSGGKVTKDNVILKSQSCQPSNQYNAEICKVTG